MVNKKLNFKKLGIFCAVILVIIGVVVYFVIGMVKEAKLRETNEYKLGEVGYTNNEIKVIKSKLNDKQIDKIISSKYKKNLVKFLKEKYFIYENLDRYLDYVSSNSDTSSSEVVSIVNTNADTEWYSKVDETDISKGTLMLVNKFNGLGEDYVPEDLINVSGTYGFVDKNVVHKVSKSIYDDLTDMLDSAKEDGYTLLVSQGYRSYEDQMDAYKRIQDASGTSTADREAARAGHSEYQTGLSVEFSVYGEEVGTEKEWLQNNSYKYGFILRYPDDTSDITGFVSNNWRYRYVGVDVATKIHNEGITFDEYYAYYLK